MQMLPEHFFSISEEARLFLGSCLLGLPIGMLLDIFRLLRATLPHHAIAVFLEDVCFALAAMVMLQCYATMFARSDLRGYFAVGALLGLTLYLLTIGTVWMQILRKLKHCLILPKRVFCRIRRKIHGFFVRFTEKRRNPKKNVESP